MPDGSRLYVAESFGRKFDDIDGELAKYVTVCGLDLLDPRLVDRVLRGDASMCCQQGCAGFDKMRRLLIMHFLLQAEAVEALGPGPAQALIDRGIARLGARLAPSGPN